jgi:hypothetical protein
MKQASLCGLVAGAMLYFCTHQVQAQEASPASSTTTQPAPKAKKSAKDKAVPAATTTTPVKKGDEPQQLQEVVVSATLNAKAPKNVPASTSTYSAKQLERHQDSNIRDVVHDELDVSTLNSAGGGGPGGNSGAGIQGYNIRSVVFTRLAVTTRTSIRSSASRS